MSKKSKLINLQGEELVPELSLFDQSLKPVRDLDGRVREVGYMLDKNNIVELELLAEVSDSAYLVNSATVGLGLIPKGTLVFFNVEEVEEYKVRYANNNIQSLEEYKLTPTTLIAFEKE